MDPVLGLVLAGLSVAALLAFVWFGLSRWSSIMHRHRANEERAQRGDEVLPQEKRKRPSRLASPAWFSARGAEAKAVARALGLRTAVPVAWDEGLQRAAEGLFVAPCLDGAVCALGSDAWLRADGDELEKVLARLSLACGEAAWFGMDASRSRFGWALARGGVVLRAWCGDGDDEFVLWSVGSPTGDERALGFFVDDPRDGTDDEHKWWPIADDVRALAQRWGALPEADESDATAGLLGRI